jgi:hypothetical protein
MVSYKRKRSSYISKRKSPKRKSPKRKSPKRKSIKRKSIKRKSPKRKSIKRKSIKRKSIKRKSIKRKSIKKSRSNDLNEEMQKFALLAYLSGPSNQENVYSWNPKVLSTKNVRILTDQWGTDDGGKTYYYDAVVKAKSMNDVSSWIRNHKNFDYIKELKLSKNQ